MSLDFAPEAIPAIRLGRVKLPKLLHRALAWVVEIMQAPMQALF